MVLPYEGEENPYSGRVIGVHKKTQENLKKKPITSKNVSKMWKKDSIATANITFVTYVKIFNILTAVLMLPTKKHLNVINVRNILLKKPRRL